MQKVPSRIQIIKTTFLVASLILYSFGVGPIKAFAGNIMAGIASSISVHLLSQEWSLIHHQLKVNPNITLLIKKTLRIKTTTQPF